MESIPRKYTEEEDTIILSGKYTVKELAEKWDRSPQSIYNRFYRLEKNKAYLEARTKSRKKYYEKTEPALYKFKWEQWEKDLLNAKISDEDIADILDRTLHAIQVMRYKIKKGEA